MDEIIIPENAGRQPNVVCAKCKRDIKQQYNEKTKNFQYAEVFPGFKGKYYCNDCYLIKIK